MTIPPTFRKVNPGDFPVLYLSLVPNDAAVDGRRICARPCWRRRSRNCRASRRWWSIGAQKFAIRVQADPEAAAARNISLEEVAHASSQGQFLDAGRHPDWAEAERRP